MRRHVANPERIAVDTGAGDGRVLSVEHGRALLFEAPNEFEFVVQSWGMYSRGRKGMETGMERWRSIEGAVVISYPCAPSLRQMYIVRGHAEMKPC